MSVSAAVTSMLEADSIDLDELLEARMLLEVPLAGLAAQRASDEELAALQALGHELDAVADDVERIGELDARLHQMVADIAANRLVGAFTGWIVDVLQPRVVKVIEPAVVEVVIADQHRMLIEAIARGDPHGAERAMREHLVYLESGHRGVQRWLRHGGGPRGGGMAGRGGGPRWGSSAPGRPG